MDDTYEKIEEYNTNKKRKILIAFDEIDKYEYLTGEEIVTSSQNRITEPAKFTYSRLGKAFEKHVKRTEYQGEKQIKELEEHGEELVKSNASAEIEELSIPLDNQKEIFYKLVSEKTREIELHNSVDFDNLVYYLKAPTKDIDFNDFIDAKSFC